MYLRGILFILLFLSTCGNITLKLVKDGSDKVTMELPKNGIISKEYAVAELDGEIQEQDGVDDLFVQEKGNNIITPFRVNDNPDLYVPSVADLATL